jgi:hypothetical protein
MHICARCEARIHKKEPPMLIISGQRISYFCTIRCRNEFDLRSDRDRRMTLERRLCGDPIYALCSSERRSGKDRRNGRERRKLKPQRLMEVTEMEMELRG